MGKDRYSITTTLSLSKDHAEFVKLYIEEGTFGRYVSKLIREDYERTTGELLDSAGHEEVLSKLVAQVESLVEANKAHGTLGYRNAVENRKNEEERPTSNASASNMFGSDDEDEDISEEAMMEGLRMSLNAISEEKKAVPVEEKPKKSKKGRLGEIAAINKSMGG